MFGDVIYNYGHTSAAQMRRMMPELWDRLWSFGVVRNPWDRTVSLYYRTSYTDREKRATFRNNLDWQRADFVGWLESIEYPRGHVWMTDFSPAHLLTDGERALVSQVLRFEDLTHTYTTIEAKTGKALPNELSYLKTSQIPKFSYRELIRDRAIVDAIAEVGAWEIKAFGYRF